MTPKPLLPFLSPVLFLLAASAAAQDRFHARFSEDLRSVEAGICFDGAAPGRLYRHSAAANHASQLRFEGRELDTRDRGSRLDLPPLPEDACLDWTVDLGAAADAGDQRMALRVGDDVLAVTGLWYWKGPWRRTLVAEVDLPEGASLSVPWTPDSEVPGRYHPVPTPSGWATRSAVGRFETRVLDLPGGTIHLALLGELDAAQSDRLTRFVERSAAATVPVFGRFPRAHVQVVVTPIGARDEPVPWAHVLRGGGASVQFYVDPDRPLAEFDADWTATHEFSHLLLPFVAREDRWLSEGLASYYQNVLRARDGRLDERQAWQELEAGFGRGRRATRRETLNRAMRDGWGSIMRVYWTGAAMMLQADAALRRESGGAQSLDTALAAFSHCCHEDGRRWSAREVLEALDRVSDTEVFMTVYRDNIERAAFPELDELYARMGISVDRGAVRLTDEAPLAGVRAAIMAGPAGTAPAPAPGDAPSPHPPIPPAD